MNIVESVVGYFVGLWCLFVTRCETVMVSGVYRKLVYCLVCRDILIHNICIHQLLLNYTDIHTRGGSSIEETEEGPPQTF